MSINTVAERWLSELDIAGSLHLVDDHQRLVQPRPPRELIITGPVRLAVVAERHPLYGRVFAENFAGLYTQTDGRVLTIAPLGELDKKSFCLEPWRFNRPRDNDCVLREALSRSGFYGGACFQNADVPNLFLCIGIADNTQIYSISRSPRPSVETVENETRAA